MDINSLLSPSDTPTSETPPASPSGRTKRPGHLNKRNSSALSQQVHLTSSPLHSPKDQLLTPLSHRDAPNLQYPHASPGVTSAPYTNGRVASAASTPTSGDGRASLPPMMRQGSTPGMEAFADLASVQHHHQAARDMLPSSRNQAYSQQSLPRSLSATSGKDVVMAERSPNLPKSFRTQALSAEDSRVLAQLSQQLNEKPLDHGAHIQYIALLKQGLTAHTASGRPAQTYELYQELREARQAMDATYTLGEDLWLEWLEDEKAGASNTDERLKVMELYTKCVEEEPASSKLWSSYGDYMYSLWGSSNRQPEFQSFSEEDCLVGKEAFTWELMMKVWNDGIAATQWHINGSQLVWNRCVDIILKDQREHPAPSKLSHLENMFATRLMKPHITWDQTFQLYSSFISSYYSANYEDIMANATKQASQAKKQFGVREPFETKVQMALQAGDRDAEWKALKSYLDWEIRHKGVFSFDLINGLYERASTRFSTDASLWEDYIEYLIENPNQSVSVLTVVVRATRHCPWSGDLWSHRLLALEAEKKSFEEMELVKHKATESGMLDLGGMEELLKVYVSWCGFLRRKAFENRNATEDDIDIAEMGIRSALEHVKEIGRKKYGKDFQGDPMYRLERIHIKFFTQSSNVNAARELWEALVPQLKDSYEFWYRYYIWEMVIWSKFSTRDNISQMRPPYEATALLRKALKRISTMDWPEQLIPMFLNHCEQHESIQELRSAIIEARRANIDVTKRREIEAADAAAAQAPESESHRSIVQADVSMEDVQNHGKRKRDNEAAIDGGQMNKKTKADHEAEPMTQSIELDSQQSVPQPTRDRENTTIVVKHLPLDAAEGKIRQFFRDAGKVINLQLIQESDSQTATIEFESREEAEYALTKQARPFYGNDIEITLGTETTLFVTNYPPEADEAYLRAILEPFGEVVAVRFPSLKHNAKRRFCYVQFMTREQAADATSLDGEELSDKLKLVVKVSNPGIKQDRSGPVYEGREVMVRNFAWEASGKDFQDLMQEHGTIESVRLPTNFNGKHKGVGFVVYKTKSEADQAVEAINGKPFRGRNLAALICDPDHKTKNIARATIASATPETEVPDSLGYKTYKDRSLFLLNVPDTVNDARLRALAEKYGPINKLILMHDHQGALIEFKNLSDQGKASLGLDGFEIIPGRVLRIGTSAELRATKEEYKSDKLGGKKRQPKPVTALSDGKASSLKLLSTQSRSLQPSRRGGRGGLGFRPSQSSSRPSLKQTTPTSNVSEVPKSNADFKAMFLGGGGEKKERE